MSHYNPKHKQAIPVPDVDVFARPLGKFQWSCPNCSQEFPLRPIDWKMAAAKCARCQNQFKLGLGFNYLDSPYALFMGKWNVYTSNRLNPTGSFADGRVTGTLEWECPKCSHHQESFLKDKLIECNSCAQKYFVNLLIYRASKSPKTRCPLDWVFHAKTVQPLSDSAANQSSGT